MRITVANLYNKANYSFNSGYAGGVAKALLNVTFGRTGNKIFPSALGQHSLMVCRQYQSGLSEATWWSIETTLMNFEELIVAALSVTLLSYSVRLC